ncbi:hypothetical protein C5167_017900 [Papaver somniferum]|uniref:Cytochrome P450 n=1 Tax=Papaver somniferum TaxID=3469 RepID=A0A4Y7IKR6_PAPSO|nr:hypothetical protein C5167_017900 [Papaver somniferum]
MMASSLIIMFSLVIIIILWYGMRASYSLWWKPKKLEKQLKQQGIKGSSYKFYYGDMKEFLQAIMEALSKPMNLNHHIAPRAVPFTWKTVETYGKLSFNWNGTTPRLIIGDPEMMKDVMTEKNGHIQKPPMDSKGNHKPGRREMGMMPAFTTSSSDLIARWKKLADPTTGSCELDIWPEMETLTSDIISRTAFGSNYEEGKRLFELQNKQIALVIEAIRSIYIPEVIEECKVFYIAGQETTRSLLTFTMIVLAMHPNWQEKAREEVEQICGKNVPDFNAINRLKIMEMVFYEVLRLYPPGPELHRYTIKRTKLGNLTIPAGVILTVPLILAHHDPEYWGDDSVEFKPERFAEGVSNAPKDKLAYFPFSRGPKVCIGQSFALIEAKMALTMILQHFSFQISPSYTRAPCVVLNLAPQHGAQIILHKL